MIPAVLCCPAFKRLSEKRQSAEFFEIVFQLCGVFKQLAGIAQKGLSGLRQAEDLVFSVEQSHAEFIFKSGYRPRCSGVANKKILRSGGIASVLRHGYEYAELFEFHLRN